MTFLTRTAALALLLCFAAFAGAAPAGAPFTVPVEYHKLDNGLRVVLSRDTTAPKAVVRSTTTSAFPSSPRTGPDSRTSSST